MMMKSKKRILSCALSILLLMTVFTAVPASVSAAEYESFGTFFDDKTGFTYKMLDEGYTTCIVTEYDGRNMNMVIPQVLGGAKTIRIDAFAFYKMDITSVSIPNTVTYIDDASFNTCTKLTEVTVPDSVQFIGMIAFGNCSTLKKITFGAGVTKTGSQVLINCPALEEVTFSEGYRYIGSKFMTGCPNLKVLNIPDSVTYIGVQAFTDCKKIEQAYLGTGVTSLDAFAFKGSTSLKSLKIYMKTIPADAFSGCTSLSSLLLGKGVETIGVRAFQGCTSLQGTVGIPDGVTQIQDYAFKDTKIEHLTVGKGVTSLSYSFFQMPSLKTVVLPDTLTSLGYVTFGNCANLEKVYIPKSVVNIDLNMASGYTHLTVYGFNGSAAQTYAANKGVAFVSMDGTDKSALKTAIKAAEDKAKEGLEEFTEESVEKFLQAYQNALGVLQDAFASQQQITDAELALTTAQKELDPGVVPKRTGDLNGDGEVNVRDVVILQKYLASIVSLNAAQIKAADADHNGAVNIKDVLQMQKYIVKLIPSLD